MPLPLAMMIPFMGIQSAVMAKSFGENFQFGKRRISALSNEEFNKLTPQTILEQNTRELKSMIPSMEQSVIEMRTFQTFLIKEFIKMLNDSIGAGLGALFGFDANTVFNAPPPPAPTITEPIGGTPTFTEPVEPAPAPTPDPTQFEDEPILPPEQINVKNLSANQKATANPIIWASGRIQPSGSSTGGLNIYTNLEPNSGTPKWSILKTAVSLHDALAMANQWWPISQYYQHRPNGAGTYPKFWILDRS